MTRAFRRAEGRAEAKRHERNASTALKAIATAREECARIGHPEFFRLDAADEAVIVAAAARRPVDGARLGEALDALMRAGLAATAAYAQTAIGINVWADDPGQ